MSTATTESTHAAAKGEVVAVNKDNMIQTIVKDGFHPYDEVYRGVPDAQRPPKP